MLVFIFIFACLCILCSPFLRCFLSNIFYSLWYLILDLFNYIRYQKWKNFNEFGIHMYVGMFGHGKTLTMSMKAERLYKRYGDSIRFLSNYKLNNIPYIPLVNFNQLVDLGEDENDYQGTVVLIDEVQTLLNHRNFSNFPMSLLAMLMQQRKRKTVIYCSAQRFSHVDKLFRDITTDVIDCNKYWRFLHYKTYDAWDMEQALNSNLLRPLSNKWDFVHNFHFNAYDTTQMISRDSAKDFLSNEEALVKQSAELMTNSDGVRRPSKNLIKERRKRRGKK